MEHEKHVCNASKEVSSCQVPQQVVDGVVETPVDDDSSDDQQVGQEHNDTHCQAQGNYQDILRSPVCSQLFAAVVVEEPHSLIVKTVLHCCCPKEGREYR